MPASHPNETAAHDSAVATIDFLVMPTPPHPRIGWAFTCRAGGFSHGPWGGYLSPALSPAADTVPAGDGPHGNLAAPRHIPAPPRQPPHESVRSGNDSPLMASRSGGKAAPPGLNLGPHCGDDPQAVARNRLLLSNAIGQPIQWLNQVHGTGVFLFGQAQNPQACTPDADAQIIEQPGQAIAIMVADCLPVLLADQQGRAVGAAHAGWRGLLDGVLEATVKQMQRRLPDARLVAWLGPCIGPSAFEVGQEVRDAFIAHDAASAAAFKPGPIAGKWLANLPELARQRLNSLGINEIHTAGLCTYSQPERFWSYRRDGSCGRMAGLIWLRN